MRGLRDLGPGLMGARWTTIAGCFAAAGVAFVAALVRQRGVPRYRTVWAEDGQVFGQCAISDPSPLHCLIAPYEGYVHIVPRLGAWLATSLPLGWFSYVLSGLAAAILGACVFLVARAVATSTGSWVAGITAGASLALAYPAGAEVAGNLTNLPWILLLASAAVLACGFLGRELRATDIALVILTIASSAFGLLLVLGVGATWILMGGRRRGERPRLLIAAGTLAMIQVAVDIVAPRPPTPLPPVGPLSPVGWFLELVYVKGPFGGRGLVPGWVVGVAASAVLAALVWQRYRRRMKISSTHPDAPRWGPPAALAFLGIVGAAVFGASSLLNAHVAPRYEYVPAAGLVVALMIGVASLGREWAAARTIRGLSISAGQILTGAVALVVAIGFASTFRVRSGASAGPSYPASLEDASTSCATRASVVVRISPLVAGAVSASWYVEIPCDRI